MFKVRNLILLTLLMFLAVLGNSNQSSAFVMWDDSDIMTEKVNGVTYTYCYTTNGKECWIRKIKVPSSKSTLKVPKRLDGVEVTRIGYPNTEEMEYSEATQNIFHVAAGEGARFQANQKNLKKIILPDTITNILHASFAGLVNLQEINLPNELIELDGGVFWNCKKLKKVHIPKSTTILTNGTFGGCTSLEKITIAKDNTRYMVYKDCILSKDKTIYYGPSKDSDKLRVPVGVTQMKSLTAGTFKVNKLYLPKTLEKIEKSSGVIGGETQCIINKKNLTYGNAGKHIYNKKTGELVLAFVDNGVVKIPGRVKKITESSIAIGEKKIHKVIIPESVKIIESNWNTNWSFKYNREIHFLGKKPPVAASKYAVMLRAKYFAPKRSVKAYKKWLKEEVVFPEMSTLNGKRLPENK